MEPNELMSRLNKVMIVKEADDFLTEATPEILEQMRNLHDKGVSRPLTCEDAAEQGRFKAAVAANPRDVDLRFVYSDWLEERGCLNEAKSQRVAAASIKAYKDRWRSPTLEMIKVLLERLVAPFRIKVDVRMSQYPANRHLELRFESLPAQQYGNVAVVQKLISFREMCLVRDVDNWLTMLTEQSVLKLMRAFRQDALSL